VEVKKNYRVGVGLSRVWGWEDWDLVEAEKMSQNLMALLFISDFVDSSLQNDTSLNYANPIYYFLSFSPQNSS